MKKLQDLDQKYRFVMIALAFLGALDSIYLSIAKLTSNEQMCVVGFGDCWSVNTSVYSELFGIPIALIGALAYITIILALLLETKNAVLKSYAPIVAMGICLSGVLYSIFLTYIEIVVIQKICPFCVVSAVIMLLLFVFSVARLVNSQAETNL